MRVYPHYRDSGVEWLGEVPEHWEVRPLKSVLARNEGGVWGGDPEDDEGTIVLRSTEQTVDGGWSIDDPARRVLSSQARREAVLAAGDLVVTKSSGSELHIGKTSLVTHREAQLEACFSNFMQRLRCLPTFNPRLAWFLLNSPVGRQQLVFGSNTTTGLANLNATILGDIVTPIPPLDEQHAIAAFLDRETERIDSLIAKKRLLMERLREYRTALITRTVTRGLPPAAARAAGLDPSPRLKPSGVEWLGDVPEHWAIGRFSREVDIAEGQVNPEAEPFASMLLIAPNHIESGTGQLMETHTSAEQGAISGKYLCRHGEVIYSKIRPALAKVTLAPTDCLCSADMYPMRTRRSLMNEYLYWLLLSKGFTIWSVLEADRVAMPKINRETLSTLRLPLPPISEQRALTDYLRLEIARLGRLQSRIGTAIERLDEMRAALVTSAVTGKIDVRESAMIVEGSAELPA